MRLNPTCHRAETIHHFHPWLATGLAKAPAGSAVADSHRLLLATVIVGFYAWMRPLRDDWSHLRTRLVCKAQSGPTPPP